MAEMEILIVRESIDATTLEALARGWYDTMVKGVADLERGIIALGGDWHIDANNILILDGSEQKNLWGFNIQVEEKSEIEYVSLINIRPAQNNRAMEIEDEGIRKAMFTLIKKLVPGV